MNHDNSDLFYTESSIKKEAQWPKSQYRFPRAIVNPAPALTPAPTKPVVVEGFVGQFNVLTENMLIILLLVIVVIMCTFIYNTLKQTCETMKLIMTVIMAKR